MNQQVAVLCIGPFTETYQLILKQLISLGYHSFSYEIIEEDPALFQEVIQKSVAQVDLLICIGNKARFEEAQAKFPFLQILWLPDDFALCKDLCCNVASHFKSVVQDLQKLLIQEKKTLAIAESCTGGFLSHIITSEPGASEYFLGSFVTYSNTLKRSLLRVKQETLELYGAVSSQTVEEMAAGVLFYAGSDFSLAISGVAGPAGGTKQNPVGTVWVGIGCRSGSLESHKFEFIGDRKMVIFQSSYQALLLLFNSLNK